MGRGKDDNLMLGRAMSYTGSIPVRIPAKTNSEVRAVASVTQRTPGALLAEAWEAYITAHREELERDFNAIGEFLREGDTESLSKFLQRNAEAQADEMMRKAGLTD